MLALLKRIRHRLRLRTRWRAFRQAPRLYRERFRYALRRALWDEIKLPLWVTSPTGTRFFLSQDPIDETIAQDIVSHPDRLYPPSDLLGSGPGVILDIGGHHGLYAAEALRRYPERRLIVVEPHPGWCRLIRKNLAANGARDRVRVVAACLALDDAKRTLRFDPDSSWGATVDAGASGRHAVEVESLTLAEILQSELAAMIYCNAEGAEYSLVPGVKQLKDRPRVMVLCVHPEYGDADALRREVRAMGYAESDLSSNSARPAYHYIMTTAR